MKKQNKKKVSQELQKLIELVKEDNINILDCTGLDYEFDTRTENHQGTKVTYKTGKISVNINLHLFKDFTNISKEKIKIIYEKSKRKSRNV